MSSTGGRLALRNPSAADELSVASPAPDGSAEDAAVDGVAEEAATAGLAGLLDGAADGDEGDSGAAGGADEHPNMPNANVSRATDRSKSFIVTAATARNAGSLSWLHRYGEGTSVLKRSVPFRCTSRDAIELTGVFLAKMPQTRTIAGGLTRVSQ
ncbi:MAG: hypothetical protein QM784_11190 [Polyangiaceae bacterium]